MAKYEQLAQKILNDIDTGRLQAGDKMQSLRHFAKSHQISMSTAVSCYAELESRGIIQSRPKAGFYVTTTPKLQPLRWQSFQSISTSPKITEIVAAKPVTGPLGISMLHLDEATQKDLARSLKRATRKTARLLMQYPQGQGEPELREALANHFNQIGFSFHPDELIITAGCMDAVKIALSVCSKPGDTIAVSSPCYHGLLALLAASSLNVIEIPSCEDGIDLDQLEALLKQQSIQVGLFCTTHMNPQGLTLSTQQKQQLARLANHYQIPIIEDDVYLELSHNQHHPLPATYYDTQGYMLWCSSISKSISPSYRIGWCRPGRYYQAYAQKSMGIATLIQYTLADFIQSGSYTRHLKRACYQLHLRQQQYLTYLAQHLPNDCSVTQPEGGLVLWIDIPRLNSHTFSIAAYQAHLDIYTGPMFTLSSRYQHCLRINIGFPIEQKSVQTALKTFIQLITQNLK
ncbi:PLP-dependent aminotransferase family protein [Celerinatantimonas sp. YJH-8]|uniref:aminotransferase-like domain-containing protein n=1 Tax=Celerinatantimonas sp. YJH-8 TaxID=3228714 RepID=UPI0038C8A736